MTYTKDTLERFADDIPNHKIRTAFQNAMASIQFETRSGFERCCDHQVECALKGTIAEREIDALRKKIIFYVREEEM